MSDKRFSAFSAELRQLRMGHDLTRSEVARLLGIGPSTLARWEDGKSLPQSATLWKVLRELDQAKSQNKSSQSYVNELKSIFEGYARREGLQFGADHQARITKIERELSSSVLKAANTDFRLNDATKEIEPTPFVADLEIFRHPSILDVKDLLESLSKQAAELIDDVSLANVNTNFICRALSNYEEESRKERPNPRWLLAKGDQIKASSRDETFISAVNNITLDSLEMFLRDHDELVRRYFGNSLIEARSFTESDISESRFDEAKMTLEEADRVIDTLSNISGSDEIKISPRAGNLFKDVLVDIHDLSEAARQSNDPAVNRRYLRHFVVSLVHGMLFVGRLTFRVLSSVLQMGERSFKIASTVEKLAPGTLAKIYNKLCEIFPKLPPWLF